MRQIFLSLLAVAMCIGCSAPSPKKQRLDQLKSQYDKFIALTFDDGPSSTTIGILDVLEQYDATATFFVMGQNVNETTRHIIERATSLGCEICNHSFSHPYMSQLSAEEQIEQARKTTQAIEQYTSTPKYFRPPYMDADSTTHRVIPQIFVGGSCPTDWDSSVSVEQRIEGLMQRACDGQIFLLHDFEGNNATPEALKVVIPTLQRLGYGFVSVDELFTLKNFTPQKGVIHKRVEPKEEI